MPKPFEKWTVFPHGPIEKLEDDLWRVEGPVPPKAPIRRTMIIARLGDGRLVIHNAIALDEDEMAEIERWGTPSVLIVPNGSHRLDAKIFKSRYPSLRVLGPPGSKSKIEEVVKVDATEGSYDSLTYAPLEGTGGREGVLTFRSPHGTTLVFNDVLMNLRSLPGFGGFMMGAFGFTSSKPRVTGPARMLVVKDKKALRTELEKHAATPSLARVEVGHGDPITNSPGQALREAAAEL